MLMVINQRRWDLVLHYSGPARQRVVVATCGAGGALADVISRPQLHYCTGCGSVIVLDRRTRGAAQLTSDRNYTDRRARDIQELTGHLQAAPVVVVGSSTAVRQ